VLTTHGYVRGEDPVGALAAVLARRGCPRPVWITETGINGGRRDACRRLDALLRAWEAGGRVAAAFNYTFRTDDRFRSGLVSTNLATAYPTLRVWEAWAARPQPPPDPCPG
jgi:hypothetical protein